MWKKIKVWRKQLLCVGTGMFLGAAAWILQERDPVIKEGNVLDRKNFSLFAHGFSADSRPDSAGKGDVAFKNGIGVTVKGTVGTAGKRFFHQVFCTDEMRQRTSAPLLQNDRMPHPHPKLFRRFGMLGKQEKQGGRQNFLQFL